MVCPCNHAQIHVAVPSISTKLGIFKTKENRHSMMKQCCQRGHEKNPYPLQSVHMHHPVRAGFDPQPPRPKLPRNPYKVAPLLVHQFE